MSQVRQTVLNNDANTRQNLNSSKASGDVASKKKSLNNKSKNSIPKSLRYDLENALLGLCDVWFEEIKPYLVRNNIKVHSHAGGGDLKRSPAPPDCTHTDPGRSNHHRRRNASYVDSSSMQLTASKVPCRKPTQQLPVVITKNPIAIPIQPYSSKKETVRKPRKRRKCQAQTYPRQLIPRLCRTEIRPICTEVYSPKETLIKPSRSIKANYYPKRKKHRTIDTSTQTEDLVVNPTYSKFTLFPSTVTFSIPYNKHRQSHRTTERTESPLFKSTSEYDSIMSNTSNSRWHTGGSHISLKLKIVVSDDNSVPSDSYHVLNLLLYFMSYSGIKENDLIDIIAEKHDKVLKVLYTSPRRSENTSIMNLFSPSDICRKTNRKLKVTPPPWK